MSRLAGSEDDPLLQADATDVLLRLLKVAQCAADKAQLWTPFSALRATLRLLGMSLSLSWALGHAPRRSFKSFAISTGSCAPASTALWRVVRRTLAGKGALRPKVCAYLLLPDRKRQSVGDETPSSRQSEMRPHSGNDREVLVVVNFLSLL